MMIIITITMTVMTIVIMLTACSCVLLQGMNTPYAVFRRATTVSSITYLSIVVKHLSLSRFPLPSPPCGSCPLWTRSTQSRTNGPCLYPGIACSSDRCSALIGKSNNTHCKTILETKKCERTNHIRCSIQKRPWQYWTLAQGGVRLDRQSVQQINKIEFTYSTPSLRRFTLREKYLQYYTVP